jgi:dTDP-4-dehydrorhamnose 3,5-epimerase|tara:strand:+ start:396 stop:929 length:534 start_codon:yes stop_codon:yes gene_type:complete
MNFIPQKVNDHLLIIPDLHDDERGVFRRSFCKEVFKKNGINFNVEQGNISENYNKHTLRGFHYQSTPSNESKILTCISGSLFNIVLDLRENSSTYKKWSSVEINSQERQSLYVPSGCANAFLTLKDNTIVHYYMNDFYNPSSYKGIRYNDPAFSFEWPHEPKIISEKDLNFSDFIDG